MRNAYLLAPLLLALSSCSTPTFDSKAEEAAIRAVLHAEEIAWNNGDIDSFMEGYWKSDSLLFVRARGSSFGWQAALDNYKMAYPDRAAMGTLRFTLHAIRPLSETHFLVAGKYFITRLRGNLDGSFTLVFRKIDGKWVAIYDHTG
ncbi:MAG: nuclear transport factor 2 family protein [Cytophagales bacterium]|nr:nuclear transport factor 2 family protein [Cytophagales bacterium]